MKMTVTNQNSIHDQISIILYFSNSCNHSVQNIFYLPLQNVRDGEE